MDELKALIAVIKTGTPAEVKAAQKRVVSIWNRSCRDDAARLKFSIFLEEARSFDKIADPEHQAYFVNTLRWGLYFAQPGTFTAWTDLLLGWVTRPEGKIRLAAVRAAQYLCVSMVSCFDEPFLKDSPHTPDVQKHARECFCRFALRAEQLTADHFEGRFKKCKYIDALPPGIYKSLQQLTYESILTCDHFEKIYEDFLAGLNKRPALPPHPMGHA